MAKGGLPRGHDPTKWSRVGWSTVSPQLSRLNIEKKNVLVLDNASYQHRFDPEVRVPEANSKKYNTQDFALEGS